MTKRLRKRELIFGVAEGKEKEVTAARVEEVKGKEEGTSGGSSENKGKKGGSSVKMPAPGSAGSGGKGSVTKAVGRTRSRFQERLNWRMTNLKMPTTSTPLRDPKTQKVNVADIKTAFGFDDSAEAEYSTIISPIAHTNPKGVKSWKIHPLSQRNVDLVEGKKTLATRVGNQVKAGGTQDRRSPRFMRDEKRVITIPISARPPAPKATSTTPVIKKNAVPVPLVLPPAEDKTPVLGDIGLPSDIDDSPSSSPATSKPEEDAVIQVPVTTSPAPKAKDVATPPPLTIKTRAKSTRTRSKKPVVEAPEIVEVEPEEKTEVILVPSDEKVVALEKLEKNPRKTAPRRTKRNVAPVAEVEQTTTARTTRATRSKKPTTDAAPVQEPPKTSTAKKVPSKAKVSRAKTKAIKTTPAPSTSATTSDIFEFEADDEQDTPAAKPVKSTKSKSRPTKKVASSSSKAKAGSKVPLHLVRKPQLFGPGTTSPSSSSSQTQQQNPTGSSPFSQLLHRYNEDDDQEKEVELHVDPKKIVRTYASRNRKRISYSEERDLEADYDFIPKPSPEETEQEHHVVPTLPSKAKRKKKATSKDKKKNAGNDEEDLDEDAKKWLEEKRREFEDVSKVKLVIEHSFSD